jgi:hypothetical protein
MFRLIYFRLYLPFLLNVFYVLYFNLFTLSLNIFLSDDLSSVYLSDRCRTCTCSTCSEPIRHLFMNDATHMNL